MGKDNNLEVFESLRPKLLGIAYRILGTVAESEDAVQDTFLKWMVSDDVAIETPEGWLTTICTRRCLDIVKSAHHKRLDYVGEWLPEPVQTEAGLNVEEQMELASSLQMAFLLLLDRLTPKERAAYLLYEIFGNDYAAVSNTLEINESACRKLVSRAKKHVQNDKVRHIISSEKQRKLLDAFQSAVMTGEIGRLENILASDVNFVADHGGKATAVLKILHGIPEISKFVKRGLHRFWQEYEWVETEINGLQGFMLKKEGEVGVTVAFDFDAQDQISDIFVMRNPDKLQNLGSIFIH
ncbi:MAG: RNA polymerase sigma factor SigJ [Sneathiella sp.]|nr:RNA polymerase sigma factor SigJ [Sneathiella sp.]